MKYYLTLDIGGTDIKYGVINSAEELVYDNTTPTEGHLGAKALIAKIKLLFNKLSEKYLLEGVAISTTGGIDNDTNVLFPNLSIKDYDGINFQTELKDLNVLVTVENDVNSMGLCEKDYIPNHENMNCLVALTVGTGIGGAIFINNQLFKGFQYTAGEFGKTYATDDGKTYENLASVKELVEEAKQIYPHIKNGKDVFDLYDNGDEKVIAVVSKFYNNLAYGIANIVYVLNPDHIVIGGGVTNRGARFLEELMAHLKDKIVTYLYNKVSISLAVNKNKAGMIGAFKNLKLKYLK